VERTERPEQERLLDPFRLPNGHIDFQIIGVTRWTVHTAHLAAPAIRLVPKPAVRVVPYLEVAAAHGRAVRYPAVFLPETFYGASTLWSLTVGVRIHAGVMRSRMGRYGVLAPMP
jgi:hypothetical protein